MKRLIFALILAVLILGLIITPLVINLSNTENLICLGITLILAITDAIIVHKITKEIDEECKE